uniref:Uncharacterized protein n=1 Tax=Rhizophagus irregularis (strain DAOM 181602 / DAOM 197198 / MUCL 43194) TaxID=747089 RepID=U9UJR7_RHIID
MWASPELRILRCDLIANNGEKTPIDGCNSYLPHNVIDYDIYRDHCLTFKANKTIKFAKQNSGIDGLQKIGFYFYDNTTAAEINTLGIASLTIQLTPPDFNFNSLTDTNKAISQMDKATLSEFKLQLNFIAGMVNYAAVVKFKTSTYRSILSGDARAIFGLGPNYHVTQKIENFINYFPFNSNPYNIPAGTTGYFSIAAGSFTQEQTSEERSNTVLGAIAAAGGAFDEINEDQGWIMKFEYKLENKFGRFANKIYQWLMNKAYIDTMFNKYKVREESLNFSSTMHKDDQKLLNEEFRKIGHVIDTYVLVNRLKNQKDQKIFAEYKHKREIKFSDNMDEKDKKLLNDEFRKIRKLIDKHLLDEPNIEKIFEAFNSQREDFSNDMDKGDKELLIDEFRQIRNVICNRLLEKDVEIKYDNSVEKLKSLKIHINDRKLLVIEFYKIKHVINSILFNESKNQEIYKEYKMNRKLKFSNEMNEKDKKLLKGEFRTIRDLVDNLLLNEQKVRKNINFSEKIDSCDKELLTYYISEVNGVRNEVRGIRNDIDNHILKIV